MRNLERKFYQLIISRIDGDRVLSTQYQEHTLELVRKGIGGFILFGGRRDEVKGFIEILRAASEQPLFIASDIERGVGQQIEGATGFPSQMAVSAAINKEIPEDVRILEDMLRSIADEAIDIGINMPLIPVMDVNQNPDNPIICTRAFSDDPEETVWYGNKYIRTLEETGLISCAKHFPGHGDTNVDSHISLPVLTKPLAELMRVDLHPFKSAIEAGVGSIMVGHLAIPEIDNTPASLSTKIVHDLLRTELGFDGLVMTDALNMHALNEYERVATRCMNAGVDILLHPADADAVVEELKQSLDSGGLDEDKIDRALSRIRTYKERIRLLEKKPIDLQRHMEVSCLISGKAVTLINGQSQLTPPLNAQASSLLYIGDENDFDISPLRGFVPHVVNINELREGETGLKETLIVTLFTSIAAWRGSSGINDKDIERIKGYLRRAERSIVISFGSPYVLRHLQEADILIAAYDSTRQAQESVISRLKGEREFRGRMPVRII